jgi:hypothetical protein
VELLLVGWICLLGGLFGLIATRRGWHESGALKGMDWFDLHDSLGGRLGSYLLYGVFGVAGLALLVYIHFKR